MASSLDFLLGRSALNRKPSPTPNLRSSEQEASRLKLRNTEAPQPGPGHVPLYLEMAPEDVRLALSWSCLDMPEYMILSPISEPGREDKPAYSSPCNVLCPFCGWYYLLSMVERPKATSNMGHGSRKQLPPKP